MADYQGLIRVGIQGLGEINRLNNALRTTADLFANLENAQVIAGQVGQSAQRNVNAAARRRAQAGSDLTAAQRTVGNVAMRRDPATGQIMGGGPNATARRLAGAQLRLAQRDARESDRLLREELQNRRLISATERRYAIAADEAADSMAAISNSAREQQARLDQVTRSIGQASYGNLLTNRYRGRQAEFLRGGGGRELSDELQQQARNVREAWDIAAAGGRENLPLMRRLSAEMAGLVREQNEFNRARSGRSIGFEAARRGQERIDELAARPGVSQSRIARLRGQAEAVITAGNRGDVAGSRDATRRMKASIMRYTRELDAAAQELSQQQRASFRNFNVRQSWRAISSEAQDRAALNARALPSQQMLAERISRTPGGVAPTRLDKLKEQEEKRLAQETKEAAKNVGRFGKKLEEEAKRLRSLGIGAPQRTAGGGIPMAGQGGRPFNQLPFPAGPGNARGIAEFQAIQRAQRRGAGSGAQPPGFFRGGLREAVGEGLIGGAFPLLFGQGLGASVGGFAGGFGGGLIGGSFGFGLSLAGTAIGQAVDTTAKNLTELADAIRSPSKALDALEKSGLASSRSLEGTRLYVDQLISVGRAYDAQTLVLQEVQKRLGPGSLTELNKLDTAQQRLQEQWGAIASEIQVRFLPVLQGFVEFLGNAAGDISGFSSQSRLERTDPETFEKLRSQAIRESSGPFGMFGDKKKYEARLSELSKQELARRFANERAQVPQTPEEKLADQTSKIQESRKLADQIQSAYREAFSLQRQAYDLQRDGAMLNRDIADYSYKKEREIFDLQQQAAEKEIENNRAAAQNRIERGDLGARQTFAAATGFEQQLLTNVRESMRTRKEGEADIEQSRRRLELTMAKLNRDVEDYKRTNAREIEDIERRKLAYTRSVEDYKMQVADYVLQRSREAADLMRQAMTLPDMSGAGGGAAGGGLATAIDRIGGAYQFRGTSLLSRKRPGDYQSDPRENFFFDRRPQYIAAAKTRIGTLSKSDLAALAFTVLTEAGPTDIGKMDVAANLLVRSAALGNAPIGAVAKQPGQYEGVFNYSRNQIEDPAFGRQRFGSRYDQTLNLLRGGMSAPATMGGAARLPGSISGRLDASGQNGADMPVGPNNEMRSYHTGLVTEISRAGNNGNYAVVQFIDDLGNRLEATYSHMAAIVKVGQQVTGGQVLGRFDASGRTFGAHNSVDINSPGTNGALQRNAETAAARRSADILVTGKVQGSGNAQAMAATQISNIPQPRFNATPLGATPSAAPLNAERMAVLSRMVGSEQEAQRILEEQNKLRQKGVELGQIEQILQGNQLPQLEQQYSTLQMQIEARRENLELSDEAASVADIQAESTARIAQLEKDRANALARAQKQFTAPQELQQATKQINEQASLAIGIARKEEEQRRKNLDLNNKLQNQERVRNEILQLQEGLAVEKAQAAALERGELQASNVELLKASTLYRDAEQAQKDKLLALTAETEELRKQNEFRQQIGQLQQERRLTGAGLRAGMIGEPARRFEQALTDERSLEEANQLAEEARLLEDQQLIWANLEKNIVDVSDAISGALTNGLLDIVSGARDIEGVGRDMLNGIARTFADSAQQQLSTLLQRQIAQFAGPKLAEMIGGGPSATGPQALGAASQAASSSIWALNNAALAASTTLQSLAAQAAASAALSGTASSFSAGAPNILGSMFGGASGISTAFSSAAGGIGSAFSSAAPDILGSVLGGASALPSFNFGGFLANGGTTSPDEAYIVGEEEPEFFFPGASGRVVPKSDLEKAAALAEENADNEPIDIRYTVTEQAGQRYVTEDQFRKGMSATSKRAQAMTLGGLRNSKQDRDYVGMD